MELADFGSIVHMVADAGTGIIITEAHYTNGFDSVRQTGEVEVPIRLVKGNHFFGYIQVREIASLTAASTSFVSSSVRDLSKW